MKYRNLSSTEKKKIIIISRNIIMARDTHWAIIIFLPEDINFLFRWKWFFLLFHLVICVKLLFHRRLFFFNIFNFLIIIYSDILNSAVISISVFCCCCVSDIYLYVALVIYNICYMFLLLSLFPKKIQAKHHSFVIRVGYQRISKIFFL